MVTVKSPHPISGDDSAGRRRGLTIPKPIFLADIAMPMAETLGHYLGDILVRPGDPGARTHDIFLRGLCSLRRLAFLQCPSGAHDELAELDDADIGRPEMFPGAVLDRALAVLDGRVLLADAGDAGEALALLL